MPQPQPGAGRPADGAEEPTVTEPPTAVPTPADAEDATAPSAPDALPATDAPPAADGPSTTDAPPATAAPSAPDAPPTTEGAPTATKDADEPGQPATAETAAATTGAATTDGPGTEPAGRAGRARGSASVPAPVAPAPPVVDPTRVEDAPPPTRVEDGPSPTRVEPQVPRWSGSAPVPPPPARRRGWGESAEPTPVPPIDSPEHATPVDPWAGVDTTGWNLPSAELPELPATTPYTMPWPVPAPPAPHPAHPVSPPAHTPPYPGPPAAPPARHPPYPGLPAARPVSPPAHTPPPGPVVPSRPPQPARPPKQRRGKTAPPAAPPPGWQAPKGYVPVPVRRRRRWPWVLLLTVACCCGVPLWWVQPLSSQYPASASLPDQLDSMRLRQDERSQADAEKLKGQVRQAHLLAEDTFAGIYATNDGKRVTLFGSTGLRFSPESDAEAELKRLAGDYELQPSVTVDTGVRGRYERCAVGRADGDTVVVCTSVDHGSLTTGVFTRLSVDDSGRLLNDLRQQVVVPKQS
ncbi:hypothetical protein O7602_05260 [Micromonospora sp. WMMD1128]|uniref:hypothetical protein n=1 Tax=unclassified Micromonospora TaxID=2617518 RepID=UPI00248AFB3F|nr:MULTISPECIES: hypothetical protein [unclassified Micromonospora]WBB74944.1 hypothetical protein O7602_05260 [Micromonospora sp. WMMD1128]WFE31680.1 hypothetical protein O7613_18930 [Micromonospora sp. WMMD975]